MPFATELPWLRRTFARGLGLLPGDRPVVLELGRVKAAPLICFEDILPEAGREAASVRPNLLVNLSNDAWFAGSREPEMHLRAAVMRAIETRRDLVRAVNVGPTSFIDATGRIREAYSVDVPAALVVQVALLDGPATIYARFGDWPVARRLRRRHWRDLRGHKTERAPDHRVTRRPLRLVRASSRRAITG